jgi:hypothetical protein
MTVLSADRHSHSALEVDGGGVEGLLDRFLRFERSEGLLARRSAGIGIWQQIRLSIFVQLCAAHGLSHSWPTPPEPPLAPRDRRLLLTRFNPLLVPRRASVVVIESRTLYRRGCERIDIYTDQIAAGLGAADVEHVDMSGNPIAAVPGLRRTSAFAIDQIRRRAARFYTRRLRQRFTVGNEAAEWRRLEARLSNEFAVPIALGAQAFSTAISFLANRIAWRCYFALRRPRLVILGVQAYGYEALVAAAQAGGARVVELQHGIIYPGHLGYQLPAPGRLDPQVDAVLTFGRIWNGAVEFASGLRLATIGFQYLRQALADYATEVAAKRLQIAVLSSGPFSGDPLLAAVASLSAASRLPIVIRPHPADPFDYAASLPPRLRPQARIASSSEPVHRLLAQSEYAVCGPSTTLFEALGFSCRTVGVLLGFHSLLAPLLVGTGTALAASPGEASRALLGAARPGDLSAWLEPRPPALRAVLDELFPGLLAG